MFATVLLAVISRNIDTKTITAGEAGLSITYALSVSYLWKQNIHVYLHK